jgi:predicted transcriptional regulator
MLRRSLRILISLHRSNVEIIASILEACQYGDNKARVIYECRLNYPQLKRYLDLLLKANLLAMENDHRSSMLIVSDKGKCFLNAYNTMKTMIE